MKICVAIVLLFLTSCDYESYHDQLGPGGLGPIACSTNTPNDTGINATVFYDQLRTEVFEPRCFSCHGNGSSSGGVNLSTFSAARAWAAQIKSAVLNNTMPKSPSPPLNHTEKNLVVSWVDSGALNSNSSGAADCGSQGSGDEDTLDPIEEPLNEVPPDSEINYDLVRNKIFKFRCFSCHSTAGGNADGLNLETYFNTLDEIEDLYEEVSERRMPPPPRPALNEIERTTLLRWVLIGAPE